MKYEYKILKADIPEATEDQLNVYGKGGWALTQIYPYDGAWYYVFVRQIVNQ